jgi:nucleotide-binding universal stress UspA family protein
MNSHSLRIQWAIDPGNDSDFYSSIPTVLRYFLRQAHAVIEPVFVLRMSPEVSADFTARWRPEYCSAAEEQLERLIRSLKIKNTMPPRVIFHDSLSIRDAVDALAADAQRSGAQLIIAQTHSRKGMRRLFVGSFAETLLLRSKLPVLLVGKEMKNFRGIRNILFPTDFGTRSQSHFNRVLDLAHLFDAKVTLFHSVQHPIEPIGAGLFPMAPLGPFPEYVQEQIIWANRRAKSWAKTADEHGVVMEFLLDEKGLSVWDQICSIASKTNVGLIAMEAQSGPVSSALLGSTTRQVVRHAPCPVLVLKPKTARAFRGLKGEPEEYLRKAA